MDPAEPRFFATPAELRAWFDAHHARDRELWLGFHKVGSGRPSVTWPEAVDEALCVGWIDGVRKSLGDESYVIRFVPRRPTSNWSAVNVKRVAALQQEGRMKPAGLKAFAARRGDGPGYTYERKTARLDGAYAAKFRTNKRAWDFYRAQPPGYQHLTAHWVLSAKREETRERRLARLIADSAAGRRIAQLTSPRSGPKAP